MSNTPSSNSGGGAGGTNPAARGAPLSKFVHKEFIPGQGLVTSSAQDAAAAAPKHRFQPTTADPASFSLSYYPPAPQPHPQAQAPHYSGFERPPQYFPRMRTMASSILLPQDLRQYFSMQTQVMMACVDADDPMVKELPPKFQSILPLESLSHRAGSSGYQTRVYKCLNVNDGFVYAVRRVDNARISSNLHLILSTWKKVNNPNVVALHELFSQNKSLFLVHDFFPGAQTLQDFILSRQHALLPERIIWSILLQILSAIRAVHYQGIACRDLNASKILMTGRFRARVACAGLVHALEPSTTTTFPLAEQQFEDVTAVGRIALSLATMTLIQNVDLPSLLDFMSKSGYSTELIQFALHPFKQHMCSIYDMIQLSSSALIAELDNLYAHTDSLEESLYKAYDCDRMFRIQLKLSLICERPPTPPHPGAVTTTTTGGSAAAAAAAANKAVLDSWSETGDRYVVKLFRDYVFHQVDEMGNAVVDLGHIIECLNKLDGGSMEQILLSSRDGKTFIVVTFEDVRRMVDASFHDLFPLE